MKSGTTASIGTVTDGGALWIEAGTIAVPSAQALGTTGGISGGRTGTTAALRGTTGPLTIPNAIDIGSNSNATAFSLSGTQPITISGPVTVDSNNSVQTLTLSGNNNTTFFLSYQGVTASPTNSNQNTFTAGSSPTASNLQIYVRLLPGLSGANVTGSNGGPFTITIPSSAAPIDPIVPVLGSVGSAVITPTTLNINGSCRCFANECDGN